ncbi:Ribonuclease H-like superfamily [Sesbania bispinosa]|nr:Ribonuclease H-like superfamily [Sesbania bispinosa]
MKPLSSSVIWRSIINATIALREGFSFQFRSGTTSVWYDDWSGLGKFCNLVPFVHIEDTNLLVRDLWQNGSWDLSILATHLLAELATTFTRIRCPVSTSSGLDSWVWDALENLFLSTIWWLWKWRNNSIFTTNSWSLEFLIRNIYISQEEFERGALLEGASSASSPVLWWSTPPLGILEAELIALKTGLQYACDRDIRNLLCESDSLEVIQLLNLNNNSLIDPYSALVNEIRVLLAKPWDVRISHIYREANLLADHLACWLHHSDDSVMLWDCPPQSALDFLSADCSV